MRSRQATDPDRLPTANSPKGPRRPFSARVEVVDEPIDLDAWAQLYVRTCLDAHGATAHTSQYYPEAG